MQSFRFQPRPNASPDDQVGVRGLQQRTRARSNSSDHTGPVLRKETSDNTALTKWGSEDPAEVARKEKRWQELRQRQKADSARVISSLDVGKALVGTLVLMRTLRFFNIPPIKASLSLLVLGLLRILYQARAPARSLPQHPKSPFTTWPILGQIGLIPFVLKHSTAMAQIINSKLQDFTTGEIVMFGGVRDFGLFEPADREYVLRTNWKNFTKNSPSITGFDEMFAEIMGRGIFAVDGDEWADHRKIAAHLFSANGLRSKMESSFTEHGLKLQDLLATMADSPRIIDFQDGSLALSPLAISPTSKPGTRGVKIPFLAQFDRLQQMTALRFILPAPVWKLMRFLNVGHERTIREDAAAVSAYVTKIIADRRESSEWATKDDLLSMYIATARASGKAHIEQDDYLKDAILNFMIAGRDTTSSALTNLFKLLGANPSVERKLIAEFEQVVGKGKPVTWDHVRSLRYAGACFNEVLRMYPPVSGDVRFTNQTDTLPSGLVVPAGSRVGFPLSAMGRDPSLWHEPDSFLPERWLAPLDPQEPVRRPDEYVFPVFWGGPRLCLGKDMARLELLSIAWAVLEKFSIEVQPHSELKVNGPVQFYAAGLPVRVHSRVGA